MLASCSVFMCSVNIVTDKLVTNWLAASEDIFFKGSSKCFNMII